MNNWQVSSKVLSMRNECSITCSLSYSVWAWEMQFKNPSPRKKNNIHNGPHILISQRRVKWVLNTIALEQVQQNTKKTEIEKHDFPEHVLLLLYVCVWVRVLNETQNCVGMNMPSRRFINTLTKRTWKILAKKMAWSIFHNFDYALANYKCFAYGMHEYAVLAIVIALVVVVSLWPLSE